MNDQHKIMQELKKCNNYHLKPDKQFFLMQMFTLTYMGEYKNSYVITLRSLPKTSKNKNEKKSEIGNNYIE